MLERALFTFGRSVHSTFSANLASGKARMDFRRPEIVFGAGSIGPGWGNGKATAVLFARHGARRSSGLRCYLPWTLNTILIVFGYL